MKRNSRRSLFAISVTGIILFAAACSKSSSTNSSAITKENLAGTYTLTSLTASIPGLPPQDVLDSLLTPCQRDDQYKLNTDFTFNYIDAGTKCSPPGDYNSTWALIGTTKIVIGADTGSNQSFNRKVLVATSTQTIQNIPVTTTETFTKQ